MRNRRKLFIGLIRIVIFFLFICQLTAVYAQDGDVLDGPEFTKARQLLTRLSPEEKAGQLFLITFNGANLEDNNEIIELITDYHIGGVVLKRENDNFSESETLLSGTYQLIKRIQLEEYQVANQSIKTGGVTTLNDYIPLFIGISQNGDGYPYDQILSGMTALPSQMAIGATWDKNLAEKAGEVLGGELSFLGFNLLLGPSLDLSESPASSVKDDLAVQTFGGDPYWVGEMGKAFISGIKTGSKDGIIVLAKHFPGIGSSDRLSNVEVATVRKSLEQLKLYELAPFSEVSRLSRIDVTALVDGFLVSHIRYQGFQGNIRATTKPVSFDSSAIEQLMSISPFTAWREKGGILVSEDLGSEAIRKFFNPSNQDFDARQIARTAFLAGNDLLFMDDLISTRDADRFETYKKIISFFIQKYKEDQIFAERVDQSLIRILAKKYQLYPEFDFDMVVGQENLISGIGNHNEIVFEIASNASVLINPGNDQILEILPNPPQTRERILIFSDVVSARQCSECAARPVVSVNGFGNALLDLYGPSASAELLPQNILSYGFEDLLEYIENPFNRLELETNFSKADWIIFVTAGYNSVSSDAMGEFLSQNYEWILEKKVVLFVFGPPYYLDATEISSFSAVYGLFSKVEHFFEFAARILFKEVSPKGSSPVSIPAISYDLITITSPDPKQVIELSVDESFIKDPKIEDLDSQEENGLNIFRLGDNLPVKTGIILDHNNHPVPDGTIVHFTLNQIGENITIQQVESATENGIAKALILLKNPGIHEIRVSSEPAPNSQILLLDISEEEGAIISAITPTPIPALPSEDGLPSGEIDVVTDNSELTSRERPGLRWLAVFIFSWITGLIVFYRTGFVESAITRAKLCFTIIIGMMVSGFVVIFWIETEYSKTGWAGFLYTFFLCLGGGVLAGGLYWMIKRKLERRLD